MDGSPYVRPATPQALLHRAPNKTDAVDTLTKPSKYIILLLAPTSVAGKVQIATSVSKSLSCPLFQGDSLQESSAKAAVVGASRSDDGGRGRYQRMWLSKMTRTGLLFPEESRPANEGFFGFGGGASSSSTPASRRGSGSSVSSTTSFATGSMGGTATGFSTVDGGSQFMTSGGMSSTSQYINRPVVTMSEEERSRKLNPALMVLTHPELEPWHKDSIREATGEYGIGVIFVPLFKTDAGQDDGLDDEGEDDMPILRPLDPRTIRGFTSFDALKAANGGSNDGKDLKYGKGKEGNLQEEVVLEVDIGGNVEEVVEEVVERVRNVMFASN